MSEEGFERFNKIAQSLKADGVYQKAELQEDLVIVTQFSHKWQTNIEHSLSGKGLMKKVGDKFPTYSGIYKVSDGQETKLAHREGEVLLIDIWATWCGSCYQSINRNQKMLEENAEAWKDKVRIVAVSVDNQIQPARQWFEENKWDRIQHLTLLGWNRQNGLIANYNLMSVPFIVLVDKTGVIDYMGYPTDINFEQKINNLIQGIKSEVPQQNQQEEQSYLGITFSPISEASHKTILENIKTIEQEVPVVQGVVTFRSKASKILKNGKEEQFYSQVSFEFRATAEQIQLRKKILNILYDNVPAADIINDSYICDQSIAFQEQKEGLTSLAKEFNVAAPYVLQSFKYTFPKQSKWTQNEQLVFSPITLPKDISIGQFLKFKKRVETFLRSVNWEVRSNKILKIILEGIPLNIVGNPFFGIQDLENTKTKEKVTLESQEGRIDLVTMYFSEECSQSYIEKLIADIKASEKKIHLHVIKDKQVFEQLEKLKAQNPDILTVYFGVQQVQEVDLLTIRSPSYLLVVDQKGIVVHAGNFNVIDFEQLISKQIPPEKSDPFVYGSPLNDLNAVIEGEEIKNLSETIKGWEYKPSIQISFEHNHHKNLSTKPVAKLTYRQSDEKAFEKIIAVLQNIAIVSKNHIETVDIPKGETCASCSCQLKLPYYFFYFSNTFRCVDCVHKTNTETENKLERYSVNENGLLVFKDNTSIDKKRLGKNVQPTESYQALNSCFICNGCRKGNEELSPRYICTGCRREPRQKEDYVDFCHECVTALVGNDEEKKKLVLEKAVPDGHQDWHGLLRVNFAPEGYFSY